MQLSPNFTLAEMCASDTARRRGIANDPLAADVRRLEALCRQVLQPIRDRFGPIHVESGYRSARLNEIVGGTRGSAHRFGAAADLWGVGRRVSCEEIWRWCIAEMQRGMPIDQVIWERRGAAEWVHVGMVTPGRMAPRNMAFKDWR